MKMADPHIDLCDVMGSRCTSARGEDQGIYSLHMECVLVQIVFKFM